MAETGLGHCKLCEIEDFRDPDLEGLIRDAYGTHRRRHSREFPRGREERKHWEVAMTLRSFRDFGVLRDDAQVLGVGAGHEATIYWLTRHVGRVFATDLYMTEDPWSATDSDWDMLVDPGKHYQGVWNPRRLSVQHMDALELEFEDATLDGVFSSSSIEHFGKLKQIRRSVEEMHRVLRPGGIAALSTEFRLDGPRKRDPGLVLFDEAELRKVLLEGLDWRLTDPLRATVSDATRSGVVEFSEALEDIEAGRDGFRAYPHIVLHDEPYTWTSVHVALVKMRPGPAPKLLERMRTRLSG